MQFLTTLVRTGGGGGVLNVFHIIDVKFYSCLCDTDESV